MKAYLSMVLIFVLMNVNLSSQSISPFVVAAAGDVITEEQFGSLGWTLGEPVTETLENTILLTQGFHQIYYTLVSVSPPPSVPLDITLYPNPCGSSFTVETPALPDDVVLSVYTLLGQKELETRLTDPVQTIVLDQIENGSLVVVIRRHDLVYRAIVVNKISL